MIQNIYHLNKYVDRLFHFKVPFLTFKIPPNIYNLDYEKQYAEYTSKQFDEFNTPEETLDREPTKFSLYQVNYFLYFFPNLFRSHPASSTYL